MLPSTQAYMQPILHIWHDYTPSKIMGSWDYGPRLRLSTFRSISFANALAALTPSRALHTRKSLYQTAGWAENTRRAFVKKA